MFGNTKKLGIISTERFYQCTRSVPKVPDLLSFLDAGVIYPHSTGGIL